MEICFILVEPAVPENIGAAARAIKTMGFAQLRLVNTKAHLKDEARWLAHASTDIIDKAEVFDSFEQAVSGLDFLIAATAGSRSVKVDYYPVDKLSSFLSDKNKSVKKAGIVFGKEESGLDNETILKCDIAATIPMKSNYPSLNLAQAVMIFAWELSTIESKPIKQLKEDGGLIYSSFKGKTEVFLKKLKIDQNQNLYNRILERTALMGDDDIRLALSVLNRFNEVSD